MPSQRPSLRAASRRAGKSRPPGRRQRAALALGIIAAVVGHRQAVAGRDRRDVRHLLRRDEIAPAHLVAAEAKLVGDAIEHALHHEGALRAAGAARRGRRHQIGEAERDLEPIRRQDVGADEIGGRILRQRKAGRRGGAVVVAQMAADREQPAVAVDRRLHLPILLALVIGGGEAFAAILDPFDRTAQQQRGRRDRQLFGIEWILGTEAAADIGRDDANALFRQTQGLDQDPLGLVRHLRAVPDREQLVGCVEAREHAARLDRMSATLVDAKMLGHAVDRAGECALDIAVFHHPMGDQIVGTVEPRLGRARLEARARLEHRGQGTHVELDQGRGILGLLPAVGHDQCNRFADVAHLLPGEDARVDVKPQRGDRQRERDAVACEHGAQIGIGQDRADAGHGPRLVGVHALQQSVGDRAADEGRMQQHPGGRCRRRTVRRRATAWHPPGAEPIGPSTPKGAHCASSCLPKDNGLGRVLIVASGLRSPARGGPSARFRR